MALIVLYINCIFIIPYLFLYILIILLCYSYVFLLCFLCGIVVIVCYSEWVFGYIRVLIRALKGRKGYIKLKNIKINVYKCGGRWGDVGNVYLKGKIYIKIGI